MNFDLELRGRRVLVTGGTKGVGAAVVEILHQAGALVVTTARSVPATSAPGVSYIAADLTTGEGCARVAKGVLDLLGGIDIVVNVVGGSSTPAGGFAVIDDDAWEREINLNLMPAVRLDRALLPTMIAQGSGVIIHVTSIQHQLPASAIDDRVCGREGGTLHLQQESLEGGDSKGSPRRSRFARLGRDRSCRPFR